MISLLAPDKAGEATIGFAGLFLFLGESCFHGGSFAGATADFLEQISTDGALVGHVCQGLEHVRWTGRVMLKRESIVAGGAFTSHPMSSFSSPRSLVVSSRICALS